MSTGIRDLLLGRLQLVTFDNQFQEAVGDELILAGGVAALGARKPKRYAMGIPVHGTSLDSDSYAAGQRMRRQIRGLLENAQARAQGFYMISAADPEQNGWLMVGAGTVGYADGGVTLSEYQLTLDEVYRVASARSYRPARRLDIYDRRLSTTPRDYLGSVYSTRYASLTGGVYASSAWFAWLPPGAVDTSGLGKSVVAAAPVFSREGLIAAVVGQTSGSVISYEQIESKRHASDVVIYDRRGQGNWSPPYTNLVQNPLTGNSTTSWGTAIFETNACTSFASVTSQVFVGLGSMQVVTSATTANQGVETTRSIPVVAGQQFTASAFLKGNAGGETVQITMEDGGGGLATQNITLTTAWQRVTVTVTAAGASNASVAVRTQGNNATTFFLAAVQVTQTSVAVQYFDGSMPGYSWTGAPYASTSTGPGGWINPHPNPSGENGTAGWGLYTGSGTGTLSVAQDDPLPPGSSLDLTGAQSTVYQLYSTATTPAAGSLAVVPGQSVYMEAWVKLLSGVPAGSQLTLGVRQFDLSGGYGSVETAAASVRTDTLRVGIWTRLSGTVTIPAGVYNVGPQVDLTSSSIFAPHFRVDNVLLCDASALGPPPKYNPAGYPNTSYFDGDSQRATWIGAQSASQSILWADPQSIYGWEEVYGAEHQLSLGDVPVLDNGICRFRAEKGDVIGTSNYLAFALDYATGPVSGGGGGWQELGRLGLVLPTLNQLTWAQLKAVSVAEWTPERAAVKLIFALAATTGANPVRAEMFVTLQRGWTAPRVETYFTSLGSTINYYWQSASSLPVVEVSAASASYAQGTAISSADAQPYSGLLSASAEPWSTLAPVGSPAQPAVTFISDEFYAFSPVFKFGNPVSWLYGGAARNNTAVAASAGTALSSTSFYSSMQLAVSAPGLMLPAAPYRNGSDATASQGSDASNVAVNTPAAPTVTPQTTGGSIPNGASTAFTIYAFNGTSLFGAVGVRSGFSSTTGAGGTNSYALSWSAVTGATNYLILASPIAGAKVVVGTTTGTTFTVTSISGTPAIPADGNTSQQTSLNGTWVKETGSSGPPTTLLAPLPANDGTYGLYLRVRLFPGDGVIAGWSITGQSPNPTVNAPGTDGSLSVTLASELIASSILGYQAGWQWIYLGEANVINANGVGTSNITLQMNRGGFSPAGSFVAVDEIAYIPTQRRVGALVSYDGARDAAAQWLTDTRTVPEVQQR